VNFVSRLLACLALLVARVAAQPLTTALEVRSLSPAEAERGREVALRGVVVFVEGPSAVFVQDATSTTFFRTQQLPLPSVGDEIELRGKTRMGLYLPGLDFSSFRVVGQRALPPGIRATYDDLVFGRFHYQRVAVEGIVRAITPLDPHRSLVRLAMGSRLLDARIEQPPQDARALIDTHVRVTGLAAGFINKARRQLVQPYVRVLGWNEVDVLAAAPPLGAVPQISAEELLTFQVSGRGEHRVRIEGVVTAVFPHEQVFLQQGDLAFGVRLATPTPLSVGDRIVVAGFPEMDRFSASVVDAMVVERASGTAPAAVQIESPDKLDEALDGKLIAVTGVLRDIFKTEEGNTVLLAGKQRTLQTRLPEAVTPPPIGARVQVTGIYQVESAVASSGFITSPALVSLRAREADDLVVLQQPPWWNARRLGGVLAALAAVTLFAALWIAVLRRQVRRQTEALRERIEAEAALEERQRIAREFHDTLEQELAGVSLRLDALATRDLDEKGRGLVAASRNLVSRIQTETRDLISDLRDATERSGDLVAALTALAGRWTVDSGVEVRLSAPRDLAPLRPATVHDLRMIARESITNAVKHARATHVSLELERRENELLLRIVDNGCGFDPAAVAKQKRGHFGCAGIAERARKIGASVTWQSTLQKGTTVELRWPTGNSTLSSARGGDSSPGVSQTSRRAVPTGTSAA
jgi:signal transduction histidine kinase